MYRFVLIIQGENASTSTYHRLMKGALYNSFKLRKLTWEVLYEVARIVWNEAYVTYLQYKMLLKYSLKQSVKCLDFHVFYENDIQLSDQFLSISFEIINLLLHCWVKLTINGNSWHLFIDIGKEKVSHNTCHFMSSSICKSKPAS